MAPSVIWLERICTVRRTAAFMSTRDGVARVRARVVEEAPDHAIEAVHLLDDDPDELARRRVVRGRRADLFEELRRSLDRARAGS